MQVLQNKVARLLIARKSYDLYNMSTEELLTHSGDLSVHQMGALQTLMMTKKILMNQKPQYLAEKLKTAENNGTRSGSVMPEEKTTLGLSREGFVFRATRLYNLLPEELKNETKIGKFKMLSKRWVKTKVAVKP